MTSSRSPLRLLRGGTAASLATAVALGGHLVGGGAMPSWLGVAIPWWLAVTLCTVLAGTRFSMPRMALAVVSSQALFHGLFTAGTPGDPTITLVAPPGSHLGHGAQSSAGAHAAQAGHGADGVAAMAGHALHGGTHDLRMLAWHLVAALVTTVLLQRGENLLLRCASLVTAVWNMLRTPPGMLEPPRPVSRPRPEPVPCRTALRHVRRAALAPLRRRGPPLVLAA
ncbi:hypothetical protein [Brachybacterium saurashtrense]|uniref:Integral membrane protein n=1 Tax=Brachybacterium saurashtrense TaxID=556288 RepID=A0A345YRE2_9MICO|nr:hypothetical protein [Brachybacterium saurashtrense]AXK46494.1 hypothetical protein DWV08_13315 [Brachybacterium saurashtrense]RRR24235.1 hypothetical protein DXU92_05065 [Brachybacterium saurashtrense]